MELTIELMVLRALKKLGGEGYSTQLRENLIESEGRTFSPGALLTKLYRMEKKAFVRSRFSEPIAERGGRRRRMFHIEDPGHWALQEYELISRLHEQQRTRNFDCCKKAGKA